MTDSPTVVDARRASRVGPWRIALTLALTVLLVALFLTQVSVTRIVDMIRGADPGLVALAVGAYALSYVGRTWRWKLLTPGRALGWPALIGVSTVHNFMVRALPSKLGEGSYLVLMKARGVPGTEALAGLVVARIYDMMVSVLFFALAVFLTQSPLRGNAVANGIIAVVVLAGAGALVLRGSLIVRLAHALAGRLLAGGRVPGFLRGRGVRIRLERLEGHLETLQSGRQAPLIFLQTLLIWGPSFVMTWWLLAAFGHPLDFWGTVFASTLGIVATLLPVSTLGNFGTQEMGWTLGMTLLGIDRETAIATGFSTHLVGFALAGLFALIGAPLNALASHRRD
jgi:uncharacterized protein (TIRG00374 family)